MPCSRTPQCLVLKEDIPDVCHKWLELLLGKQDQNSQPQAGDAKQTGEYVPAPSKIHSHLQGHHGDALKDHQHPGYTFLVDTGA